MLHEDNYLCLKDVTEDTTVNDASCLFILKIRKHIFSNCFLGYTVNFDSTVGVIQNYLRKIINKNIIYLIQFNNKIFHMQ